MNDSEQHRDLPDLLAAEERRRSFIKKGIALGGGLLIYLTPTVKTYAGGGSLLSHPAWVFDITLPAHYTMVGATPVTYSFLVQGQASPIPVDLNIAGNVDLEATSNPEVATARGAFVMTSVSANPLLPAGVNCGRLTTTFPAGTLLGQLNLRTGAWTPEASVAAILSSVSCSSENIAVSLTGGAVTRGVPGQPKCIHGGEQILTACSPGGQPTTVTGTFGTGLSVA